MKPVVMSKHAFGRMRERFPHLRDLENRVHREIHAAIEAGRRSKNPPEFIVGTKQRNGTRFVWTECETRVYIVCEKRISGVPGLMVVTVLHRSDPVAIERAPFTKQPGKQTTAGRHAPRTSRAPKWKG